MLSTYVENRPLNPLTECADRNRWRCCYLAAWPSCDLIDCTDISYSLITDQEIAAEARRAGGHILSMYSGMECFLSFRVAQTVAAWLMTRLLSRCSIMCANRSLTFSTIALILVGLRGGLLPAGKRATKVESR